MICVAFLEHFLGFFRHLTDTPGGPYFLGTAVLWAFQRRLPKD